MVNNFDCKEDKCDYLFIFQIMSIFGLCVDCSLSKCHKGHQVS